MGWTAIAASLAKIFAGLVGIFQNKQLIDAGEAQAKAELSDAEREKIALANRARINADSVFVDPWDKAYDDRH